MEGEIPPLIASDSGKLAALICRRTTRTSMQFDWRAISGPALTTATALIAFFVDRHFVAVPNPAPLFVCIVALASSVSGIASGLISAAIAVVVFGAVLPQSPRDAGLRHVGPGAHGAAGGDRRRHRRHHRHAAAEMDRRVRVGAEASRHRGCGCRRRSTRSTSASCCSMPIPAPNSSTAPSATIFRCPTSRPTASRPSSR